MKLFPLCILIGALIPGRITVAQTIPGGLMGDQPINLDAAASPTPEPEKKKGDDAAPSGPTVIDSQNMDYDEKTRKAIFTGEYYGVFVKDPQFTVNCDKLTAFMRKAAPTPAPGSKGKATPKPSPTPTPAGKGAAADAAASKAGGLQRAIAEGPLDRPVVIVQDKPAANGDQPQHNVGIAQKADYNADTGDIVLTGWPRVTQGEDTQIATSAETVMTMNKDGKTMTTRGPSRSIFTQQEKKDDTGKSAKSPAASPAP